MGFEICELDAVGGLTSGEGLFCKPNRLVFGRAWSAVCGKNLDRACGYFSGTHFGLVVFQSGQLRPALVPIWLLV